MAGYFGSLGMGGAGPDDPGLEAIKRGNEALGRTWVAELIRDALSGVGAFGQAASGQMPVTAGLRREDYTDEPAPTTASPDATRVGRALGIPPVAAQPVDPMVKAATDAGGLAMMGGIGGVPKGAVGSTFSDKLYHGSPNANLTHLTPSERGPLGPGTYTTPMEGYAKRYAGDGKVYELPAADRDIFRGHGHRTDAEWHGYKDDVKRLIAAAEPEKRPEVEKIMERMWSADGYPAYARIAQLYGGDEGAQNLFKRAGFQGLSGMVDGPEVLLFGSQPLPGNKPFHTGPLDAPIKGGVDIGPVNMPFQRQEDVLAPAVKIGDMTFPGANHADALDNAAKALKTTPEALLTRKDIDLEGFMASHTGRYMDRTEAGRLADARGQRYDADPDSPLLAEQLSPDAEQYGAATRELMKARGTTLGAGATDKRTAGIVAGAQAGRELEVRPTRENLTDLIQANFNHAKVAGNKVVPLKWLKGGTGPSKTDADRVAKLRQQMDSPEGYIERLVVDDKGNVIEGAHRVEALRQRGEKKVPVTVVRDLARGWDYETARKALDQFPMHPDQKHMLLGRVFETLDAEKGKLAGAREYEVPGFNKQFEAVLDALEAKGGKTLGSGSTDKRSAAIVAGAAGGAMFGSLAPKRDDM